MSALAAAACSGEAPSAAPDAPVTRSASAALSARYDVPADFVASKLSAALNGSEVAVTQTGGASSWTPGFALAALGMQPKTLDFSTVTEKDLGAKVAAGEFFGFGGLLLVDKIRMRANDWDASFSSTNPGVTLVPGALTATASFTTGSPSLVCEGNAWIPGLFIPLGWRDDACPDVTLTNASVTLSVTPAVSSDGQITVPSVSVVLHTAFDAGAVGNAAQVFYDYQSQLRADIESKMYARLNDVDVRNALAHAIGGVVDAWASEHVPAYASLSIDSSGIIATTSVCNATTCAAAGATCGTIPDNCGRTLDCGACAPNATCEANRCRVDSAACRQACEDALDACIDGNPGRGAAACGRAYKACVGRC